MNVNILGNPRYPSPLSRWVYDRKRVPGTIVRLVDAQPQDDDLLFEVAGARKTLLRSPRNAPGF